VQICSAVPEIFEAQTKKNKKVADSVKNRTLLGCSNDIGVVKYNEGEIGGDITASVNLDVSRDDVITVDESAALETDLTVTSVHNEDHSELCPIEASVHRDFHLSTERSPSAKLVKNDSTCSLSAEKVNKLELMQRGSCHYNEVRSLCIIYVYM